MYTERERANKQRNSNKIFQRKKIKKNKKNFLKTIDKLKQI